MNPLNNFTSETTPTLVKFPPPTNLKHRPMFMTPYEAFDGGYAGDTDAKYLSIGLAQYRKEDDTSELSAKVWRASENEAGHLEKWSRMSEEIPLHRLVDLCILLTKCFYQHHNTSAIGPIASISADTFENQNENIELKCMTPLPEAFIVESQRVKSRLRKLKDELEAAHLDDILNNIISK